MQKKHLIAYPATALIALGIGSAGGSGDSTLAAAEPAPTVTVSSSAEPQPGVTVTATPTVTVTKTAAPPAARDRHGRRRHLRGRCRHQARDLRLRPADSGNCYWERSTGGDELGSIIANDNTAGQAVVTIKKSDKFFISSGCSDWTKR